MEIHLKNLTLTFKGLPLISCYLTLFLIFKLIFFEKLMFKLTLIYHKLDTHLTLCHLRFHLGFDVS
jgi:hypothetical protein